MDRFDPFVKYADVYGDIINWEKDPMNKPQNQNKYFFSDGKTYYEQICKMLRLMSVFKEAFNQIYSNEDEISEAWENFVNNLSASVVEGSEPDVTLTWTDDSVNFEFTMVPGVPGEQGVGITSISFNSDYTMTITLSDGNTYTSMSLKGETGPQGPQGETGSGLQILDVYATLADLQSAHPTGEPGDAYQVGSEGSYTLYIWSSSQSAWVPAGSLGTVSPSLSNPLMDGTASAGSQNLYSRGDHVHPTDTSRASKEELDALIKTSQALIDQSFTYRKSPAIQDGLARIDKIKGNTLVWNQLANIGNFSSNLGSLSQSGNVITYTITSLGEYNYSNRTNKLLTSNTVANHKYLVSCDIYAPHNNTMFLYLIKVSTEGSNRSVSGNVVANQWSRINGIIQDPSAIYSTMQIAFNTTPSSGFSVNEQIQFKNLMLIDLTAMFGTGNEPSTVEEFTSLFSLPYYAYNQGSLLSFNGSGLKTIGKNAFNKNDPTLNAFINTATSAISEEAPLYRMATCHILPNTDYVVSKIAGKSFRIATLSSEPAFYAPYNMTMANHTGTSISFTSGPNDNYLAILFWSSANGDVLSIDEILNSLMVEIGSQHSSYEPYTSSTLSLPISTYFPTGMKSAGNVYDELTPRKAITRIGAVDLGSLNWGYVAETHHRFYADITGKGVKTVDDNEVANVLIAGYTTVSRTQLSNANLNVSISVSGGVPYIAITNDAYSDVTAFKTAMSGVYIYCELATPTETDVDLDLSFNAYEYGTEQLLPVNGSVPSTSPVIADMTYLSIDDAMEYIIDKLANVPQNTQQILDSLEDDISDLQTDVGALQPAVSALQTSVGNINTNIGQLSSTVAGHTASISDMQSDITDLNTGLNNLEDTVTDNTSRIGTLESGLSNTNGNVQSISSQMQSIDGRVTNLESDLLIVVKKEYDYDSVAGNTNFGVQTGLSQEPGYKIIGIVGSEVQQGEYTSAEPWIIVTQAHVHYTSTGGVVLSMMARNVSEYTKTNVRVYLYLLCIKDTQSQ